ncbi:glycosyltransferase family 4 protein, partial [Vibrio cholerae]|nr:glycosyltransferase family 4 protein [Vibrio cholerae]
LLGYINHKDIILAPRGELTKGAMSLKGFKKKVFLGMFLLFRLHKRIKFHLTSEQELRDFNAYIKTDNFIMCPNMHEPVPEYCNKEKNVNQLNVLFLSRISKKKNLEYAIKILSKVHIPEGSEITFNIVGTIEDYSYFERCKFLASKVDNVEFIFHGAATRSEVKDFMSNSHVFLLPTLNENYGHAIVEAMVNSNIVIISDNTPWNELNNFGGLAISLDDIVPFVKGIEKVLCMSNDEFNLATKNTYLFIKKSLSDNEEKIENFFG